MHDVVHVHSNSDPITPSCAHMPTIALHDSITVKEAATSTASWPLRSRRDTYVLLQHVLQPCQLALLTQRGVDAHCARLQELLLVSTPHGVQILPRSTCSPAREFPSGRLFKNSVTAGQSASMTQGRPGRFLSLIHI